MGQWIDKIVSHIGDKLSIYVLVTIIGGLVLYYNMAYVPQNEKNLNDHAFRILENKAMSIREKYHGYVNAVNAAPVSYLSAWYFKVNPDASCFYVKKDLRTAVSTTEKIVFRDTESSPPGADWERITRAEFIAERGIDEKLRPELRGPLPEDERMSIWKSKTGNAHFVFSPRHDFYEDSAVTVTGTKKRQLFRKYPFLWLSLTNFTNSIKANDLFEDLFIVRANYNNYNPTANENALRLEQAGLDFHVLDHSELGVNRLVLPDSIHKTGIGVRKELINGDTYRVYYKSIKLRRDLDIYIVALIRQSNFQRETLAVPAWFVVFASLVAIILIFVAPVVKIFILNQYERLSTMDVSSFVFSSVLCVSLLYVLCLGAILYWGIETTRADRELKKLTSDIVKQTDDDISYIKAWDFNESNLEADVTGCKQPFNELIAIDKTDGSARLIYRHVPDGTNKKSNLNKFPISLSERSYYTNLAKKTSGQYVEAINAYLTGKSELAISKVSGNSIHVFTTSAPSIIRARVPSPYKFVVLDEQGEIKFHSDWLEINHENILLESEARAELQSFLRKGISDFVDFNYLRRDCRGFHKPLSSNDGWSVLVYYELATIRDLAAQVFMMCIISLMLLLCYMVILHVILHKGKRRVTHLAARPFFYDWINPNYLTWRSWLILAFVNLGLFVAEIVGTIPNNGYLKSIIFTVAVMTSAYYINFTQLDRVNRKRAEMVLLGVLLTSVMTLVLIDASQGVTSATTLILMALVTIMAVCSRWIKVEKLTPTKFPEAPALARNYTAYHIFLCCWFLVIAIGPTQCYLLKHYRFEDTLRRFAHLVDDAENIKRNPSGQYYKLVDKPEVKTKFPDDNFDLDYYYKKMPRFTSSMIDGLHFNYYPELMSYKLSKRDDLIQVSYSSDRKYFQNIVHDLTTFEPSFSLFVAVTILLSLLVVVWIMLREVSAKIFYMPRRFDDPSLPPAQHAWGSLAFEFENNSETSHPLNGVVIEKKENNDQDRQGSNARKKAQPMDSWTYGKEIVRLREVHKVRYQARWDKCSLSERMCLYDLAEDGVINQVNKSDITRLAGMGLVRLYPRLEIVNVSFADFVRVTMEPKELKAIEDAESKSGQWNNAKIIIGIVIAAAFIFLSVAEKGFLGRATALVGSLTAVITGFFAMMGNITRAVGTQTKASGATETQQT